MLSGTPSKADLASQPLTLFVTALDGRGGMVSAPITVAVAPAAAGAGGGGVPNGVPTSLPLQPLSLTFGVAAVVDVASYFGDADRDRLVYDVEGLPRTTGLAMHPAGFLYGRPSAADLAAQQMQLIVSGVDSQGAATAQLLPLTINDDNNNNNNNDKNTPPTVAAAGQQGSGGVVPSVSHTLLEGQAFNQPFAALFTDPDPDTPRYSLMGTVPPLGTRARARTHTHTHTHTLL